ncbi:MAG: LuxR family transcriptional regulator [Brevundimonas sp.]|jgi:DNA-binding CsgD family transcriptional regulator|nr:LuxR family transcriptional regulator [Brevundimonas sp.]
MLQESLPGLFPDSAYSDFTFEDEGMSRGLSPRAYNLALMRWLETESKARVMVSEDMVVRWMSNAAKALVESGDIRVLDGHLIPRSAVVTELLNNCDTSVATCALLLDSEQRTWVVWARRLSNPPTSLIGVIFHPPLQSSRFSALVDTHTLTPSEGRVVEMLLNGLETGRIAQILNVSNETLKTHLKHIYCKMNVKSRGELFAQALGFATP